MTENKKRLPNFVEEELRNQLRGGLGGLSILNMREISRATMAHLALLGFTFEIRDTYHIHSIMIESNIKGDILCIAQHRYPPRHMMSSMKIYRISWD